MSSRQNAKPCLMGIDFAKLEQTALQMVAQGKPISVSVNSRTSYKDQLDLYSSMVAALSGNNPQTVWRDDLMRINPEPHCMKIVHEVIDGFWSPRNLGLYGLYRAQLDRNHRTKDLFKGKSTTHHYPWYRRGSKY